jgi:hypothetical protein
MPIIPATEECTSGESTIEAADGMEVRVESFKTLSISMAWWCAPVLPSRQKA